MFQCSVLLVAVSSPIVELPFHTPFQTGLGKFPPANSIAARRKSGLPTHRISTSLFR